MLKILTFCCSVDPIHLYILIKFHAVQSSILGKYLNMTGGDKRSSLNNNSVKLFKLFSSLVTVSCLSVHLHVWPILCVSVCLAANPNLLGQWLPWAYLELGLCVSASARLCFILYSCLSGRLKRMHTHISDSVAGDSRSTSWSHMFGEASGVSHLVCVVLKHTQNAVAFGREMSQRAACSRVKSL